MRKSLRIAAASGLGALAVVGLSACSDVGVGGESSAIDTTLDNPATVINMPAGRDNVAFVCHGTVGVYTINQGVDAVPDHPDCTEAS